MSLFDQIERTDAAPKARRNPCSRTTTGRLGRKWVYLRALFGIGLFAVAGCHLYTHPKDALVSKAELRSILSAPLTSPEHGPYDGLIEQIAVRHNLEPALVKAIAKVSSRFDPQFVSPDGRVGLMALPSGVVAGLGGINAFVPASNVDAGCLRLRQLLDRYGDNIPLAITAYRVGAETVEHAGGVPSDSDVQEFLARVLVARLEYLRYAPSTSKAPNLALVLATPRTVPLPPRDIARAAQLATVTVLVTGREGRTLTQGSGFAIGRVVVVTNAHVVGKSRSGTLALSSAATMLEFDSVIALDDKADLALLHVRDGDLTPLPLEERLSVEPGDHIYVMGTPSGLGGTFSDGVVSQRRVLRGIVELQIAAPVSPGSSGSPVLDERGNVVGVIKGTVRQGQNLNFAIATSHVRELISRVGTSR